jgi:hypothetical protein
MPDKSIARKLQIKPNRTALFVNAPKGCEAKLGALPEGVFVAKKIGGRVDCVQKGTSGVSTDVNRDSIASCAKTIGMRAAAQIAIGEDWSALRLKIV